MESGLRRAGVGAFPSDLQSFRLHKRPGCCKQHEMAHMLGLSDRGLMEEGDFGKLSNQPTIEGL